MGFSLALIVVLLANIQRSELCNPNATTTRPPSPATTPITTDLDSSPSPTSTTPISTSPETVPSSSQTPDPTTTEKHLDFVAEDNESIQSYEHVIVSGMPFQRGESHGKQAKAKIHQAISYYKQLSSMPIWEDCITLVRTHFIKALEHYFPNGLKEMHGIANGANVTLEDIIILNARHELVQWKKSQHHVGARETPQKSSYDNAQCAGREQSQSLCKDASTCNVTESSTTESQPLSERMVGIGTGGVVLSSSSKYAHVLLGQNWDADDIILNKDLAILLEVNPDPCEGISRFVMVAEAGQLGIFGFNEDGLGVIGTNLWSSRDVVGTPHSDKSIPSLLLRRMFVESNSFSAGFRRILKTPRYASTNLIIATAEDEALNIELTPIDYFIRKVPLEREYLAQSNHFKSSLFFIHNDDRSTEVSSLFRDRRVERKLADDWPRINERSFQNALRDEVGHPESVCLHEKNTTGIGKNETETTLITVASGILNLSQRTLLLSKGPPCLNSFKYLRFNFSQL